MRTRRLLAAAALTVLPLVSTGPAAAAATPTQTTTCATTVTDEADVLDDAKVEQEIGKFPKNVTVRVITVQNLDGDLYDRLVDAANSCSGWGFSEQPLGTLLVVGVAPAARKMGTHANGAHQDRFLNVRSDAEGGTMGPEFAAGNWTEGIIAGLNTYRTAYLHPQPTANLGESSSGHTGSGISGATVLKGLGFVAAAAVLVFTVILSALGYRRRQDTKAARTEALAARNDVAASFLEFEKEFELADVLVGDLPDNHQDQRLSAAHAAHRTLMAERDEGVYQRKYLAASERWTETAIAKAKLADLDTAKIELDEAAADMARGLDKLRALEAEVKTLYKAPEQVRDAVAKTRLVLSDVDKAIEKIGEDGFTALPEREQVAAMRDLCDQAADAVARWEITAAFDTLSEIEDRGTETLLQRVRALPRKVAQLRDNLGELRALTRNQITANHGALDDLSKLTASWATADLADLQDQAPAVRDSERQLPRLLDDAEAALDMAAQRFDEAEAKLHKVDHTLPILDRFVQDTNDRGRFLSALVDGLPDRFSDMSSKLNDLDRLVSQNRDAVNFMATKPDVLAMRRTLDGLATRTASANPAYRAIDAHLVDLVEQADKATADVTDAVREHEKAMRRLREAEDKLRRAQSRIGYSGGYRARSALDSGQSALQQASNAATLAAILSAAQSAESYARQAETAYQSHISSSSSSYGGGGSSSFGGGGGFSSFGGGGGSSSFGGGGGGGSSSF